MVAVGCSDSLGVVSGASHTTNLKGKTMNNSVALAQPVAFSPVSKAFGQNVVTKEYKNGGRAVRWMNKKEFKEAYVKSHPTASSRDISKAFNAHIKKVSEESRANILAFWSNPDVLPMGGRENKDGSKGAVTYQRKSSLKIPKDTRKATVTKEAVVASLEEGKFTRKDLEMMLDVVAIKLDEFKA